MNSQFWQKRMDYYKESGAKAQFPGAKVIYGRAEMMARAELEMSEAVEKAGAKR
jgi:hypothetical protein